QLIAALLFAATTWAVAGRRAHPQRLWMVPGLVVLWANVHGTFFLAPILLMLAWLEDRVEKAPGRSRTLGVALVSTAATLVNPFGPKVWTYVLSISTNSTITHQISEWQPPTIRTLGGDLFYASVGAVIVILVRRTRPASWV